MVSSNLGLQSFHVRIPLRIRKFLPRNSSSVCSCSYPCSARSPSGVGKICTCACLCSFSALSRLTKLQNLIMQDTFCWCYSPRGPPGIYTLLTSKIGCLVMTIPTSMWIRRPMHADQRTLVHFNGSCHLNAFHSTHICVRFKICKYTLYQLD